MSNCAPKLFSWLVFLVGAVAVLLLTLSPTTTADFWMIRATGEWIWQHQAIPKTDPFAFTTAGRIWIEHKWLFDLLAFGLSRLGEIAPILLKVIMSLGVYFGIVLQGKNGWQRTLLSCLSVLLVAGCIDRFTERAHLAGDLCLLGMIWLLRNFAATDAKPSARNKFLQLALGLFCLQIFWANLHGSFILGPVIILICLVAEIAQRSKKIRPWLVLLGLSLVGSCVTPYGWKSLLAPIQHFGLSHQSRLLLAEWQPMTWSIASWQLQLLITFTCLALFFGLRHFRLFLKSHLLKPMLMALAFTYLASHSYRFVLSAAVVILPLLPDWLEANWPKRLFKKIKISEKNLGRFSVYGVSFVALLFISAVSKTQITANLHPLALKTLPLGMPIGATNYLKRHQLHGNLFHSFDYGSYLAAELSPNFKIFIDGRLDLYSQELSSDYMYFLESEKRWLESPWRKQITAIVLSYQDPLSQGFLDSLITSGDWALVYLEENSALLLRRDVSEYQPLIANDQYVYLRPTNQMEYLQPLSSDPKKISAALKEVDRLRQAEPSFILPLLIAGRLHEIHPQPVQRALACGFFEEARQRLPNEPKIQFLLAICYGERHDLAMAINVFRNLTDVPMMREKALLNLGLCYAKMGTFQEARTTWEQLQHEFPNNFEAKKLLELLPKK